MYYMTGILDLHVAATLLTVVRIVGVGAAVVFAAVGIYLRHEH